MSFVAVLAAFSVSQAQSFEFRMDGEPVADGATVEFHAEEDELFHTYSCETGSRLALYNTSDAVINSRSETMEIYLTIRHVLCICSLRQTYT